MLGKLDGKEGSQSDWGGASNRTVQMRADRARGDWLSEELWVWF